MPPTNPSKDQTGTNNLKKKMTKDNMVSTDEYEFLIKEVIPKELTSGKLVYRLSGKSGFSARSFHKKCDEIQPSIFICEAANGMRFGGINFLTWGPQSTGGVTDKNMIFSLSKKTVHATRLNESGEFDKTRKTNKAIIYDAAKGPVMGEGDLIIGDNCHDKANCSSDLDRYELLGDEDSETYLTGEAKFKLKKFFVFSLN
jgi:hypothetical protein